MVRTTVTSKILIFAPSRSFTKDSNFFESFTDTCRKSSLTLLRSGCYFVACETASNEISFSAKQTYLVCDVLPGKRASRRVFNFAKNAPNWENWHQEASNQAQLYNLILLSQSDFSIESDPLGLKPLYIANLDEGTLIGSNLVDLFRIRGDLIKPIDRVGLAQMILTGHPFGSRTLHAKVRRTKTGERISWSSHSLELESTRPRRMKISGAVYADAGLVESICAIDDAISDSIKRHTMGATGPLNIGLSGGFDSRILAAVLSKNGEAFRAFTYGRWHHREVRTARRVARELGINHQILPYPLDNHYDRMDLFLSTMEGQSDSNSVQIANLLQLDVPQGTPMLHGFMSDAVAVTRFSDKNNGASPKSIDEAAQNLASSILKSETHSQFLSELTGVDINIGSISQELRDDMALDGLVYHSAVLWDVENRQRRFIAGHLPMLGQKFDIIVPFYDAKLMSIWFSMPRISLDERYLQRQQLAKLYPNLAKIPHSEENAPILPNLSNQLRLLLDSFMRKLFITSYQRAVGYRTSNIWSLSGGMATVEQRTRMRNQFIENLECTENVLGLSTFKTNKVEKYFTSGPLEGDYISPRIIFQTSSYAKWLADALR